MIRLLSFEFARDWVHAGVTYAAGNKIDLPEATAIRLRDLGAGTFESEPESASPRPRKRKP